MIKILADTSALVSLEIKHFVGLASKYIQFSISDGVLKELQDIAQFNDVHAKSARDVLELVEKNIIAVRPMPAREEHSQNIDLGEAEILTLSESGEYEYIITDDVKALPYIKSVANVKVFTSVFIIRLLYDINVVSKEEALNSIKEISASRDWYGGMLETIANRFFDH
ncbi:MAG: hypothetical protein Q7J10_08000 [Methanosarcinaceae archaeon]|nr:hypothetical protein [Methanosarcinaceae archaeon]